MAPRCLPDQLISVVTPGARRWRRRPAAADLINGTWGGETTRPCLRWPPSSARARCARGAPPRTRPFRVSYGTTTRGVVDAVISQVTAAAERAVAAGVAREKVLIDPHDFGNTFHGLLRHVADLVATAACADG